MSKSIESLFGAPVFYPDAKPTGVSLFMPGLHSPDAGTISHLRDALLERGQIFVPYASAVTINRKKTALTPSQQLERLNTYLPTILKCETSACNLIGQGEGCWAVGRLALRHRNNPRMNRVVLLAPSFEAGSVYARALADWVRQRHRRPVLPGEYVEEVRKMRPDDIYKRLYGTFCTDVVLPAYDPASPLVPGEERAHFPPFYGGRVTYLGSMDGTFGDSMPEVAKHVAGYIMGQD